MSEPQPSGWSVFLNELKRRHVVRVAALYAATAFVVLQAVDLLAQGLGLPTWVFSVVTVVLIAGLPIALVLAWAFELTPEGVRRTETADTAGGGCRSALAPEAIGGYVFRALVQFAAERSAEAQKTLREAITVVGAERVAVDLANRSWIRWVPFSDTTTWRSVDDLPLSSAVVDTGSFHLLRAEWLLHTGNRARATALADSAVPCLEARSESPPRDWYYWGQLAHAHAVAGRARRASDLVRRSLATLQERPDAWDEVEARYHAAKVMAAAGELEAAIGLLQSVPQPGPIPPAFIRADGRFARLRGDPRYEAVVARR